MPCDNRVLDVSLQRKLVRLSPSLVRGIVRLVSMDSRWLMAERLIGPKLPRLIVYRASSI